MNQQVLDANLINNNKLGTFSQTDANGFGTIDVAFDSTLELTHPSNRIYLAVALIQAEIGRASCRERV